MMELVSNFFLSVYDPTHVGSVTIQSQISGLFYTICSVDETKCQEPTE